MININKYKYIHTVYIYIYILHILKYSSAKILLLFKLFIGPLKVTYNIKISSHTSFILIASTRLKHTTNKLGSVTHKAVAVPLIVVAAITAFAAYDAIRVR
jgi:hypothetical protein